VTWLTLERESDSSIFWNDARMKYWERRFNAKTRTNTVIPKIRRVRIWIFMMGY
jgi:hypothetical protein